jgi:hypothetical protein
VQHELEVIGPAWAERLRSLAAETTADKQVFLLGFPRSGTTLLDQILDVHPGTAVITEKQIINRIHEVLLKQGHRIPEDLPVLDSRVVRQARNFYRNRIAYLLGGGCPAVLPVDKFPLHTIFISLIYRLFPHAKIIFAQRHPLDVCLSCFMNDFGLNAAMANFFTLESTAQLYAATMELWRRFIELFPIDYHVIKYESLVDDLEGEARKLFTFLGLDWNPVVLDFPTYAQQRDGRKTPSYHQVCQPIYRAALYRWKNYAGYLDGIRETLQPSMKFLGY